MTIQRLKELLEGAKSDEWVSTADLTMTEQEQKWKRRLVAMLLNKSGKWGPYQHALYAARLNDDFILKIVPASITKDEKQPFTAAADMENGIIYINELFLTDEKRLYQLNTLIRHELAHILLKHQIRMMAEIGKVPYSRLKMSQSIHELLNIIADFEISNKKYTQEDKDIVEKMYLNGKVISGLVTEMHRKDWLNMSLEEMYRALTEEMAKVQNLLERQAHGDYIGYSERTDFEDKQKKDMITNSALSALSYTDEESPSMFWKPLDEYIEQSKRFKKFAPYWQELVKKSYNILKDKEERQLRNILKSIVKSKPVDQVIIDRAENFDVYSPEEKSIVADVIKTLLGNAPDKPAKSTIHVKKEEHSQEFRDAYNKIIRTCGKKDKCSTEEVVEILKRIAGEMASDDDTVDM